MHFRIITSGATDLAAAAAVPQDAWTHVAGTYDGSNMRIYIDGSESNSIGKTGSIATSTIALHLGDRTNQATNRRWQGRLDDVRIYDRALSATEVQVLAGLAGVHVAVNSDVTWDGLIFNNLNGTRGGTKFYLSTSGTGLLTIDEVRFRDRVKGMDGDGTFQASSDPGTIATISTNATDPDVKVNQYFSNDKGIGGDSTDGDP